MLVHAAEQSFQKGMEFLSSGQHAEAQAFFRGAIEIERRMNGGPHQARYLSYFGFCLGQTGGDLHEAVRCCRKAARREAYRPDLCLNLGRVLLMAGRKREAYKALRKGLRMQPDNRGIRTALTRMGVRRRPVLPFLGRCSPLNVLLGRIRSNTL